MDIGEREDAPAIVIPISEPVPGAKPKERPVEPALPKPVKEPVPA